MKILFIGDIVGKIGRRAAVALVPQLRQELTPDVVIANAENIAHGAGITARTLAEIQAAGIDAFTSGNHIFDKPEVEALLTDPTVPLVRPANFSPQSSGRGWRVLPVGQSLLGLVNVMGRVFMKETLECPFRTIDAILEQLRAESVSAILVDVHAEATSEKVAFGWYVDGRVSAVVGTHTHVPTADGRMLLNGTAFVTDVGMTGSRDSVIGMGKEQAVDAFVNSGPLRADIAESGTAVLNAVLIDVDEVTGRARSIVRVDRLVEV